MESKMMNLGEAKDYVKNLNLKSETEYQIWWLENREENERIGLPQHPDEYYSNKPVEFTNQEADVIIEALADYCIRRKMDDDFYLTVKLKINKNRNKAKKLVK
jgi:hypothetical protein